MLKINFQKKALDSLIAFHNKFRLIMKTKFNSFFLTQGGLRFHQVAYPQLKSGKVSLNEPPEEIFDAFVLHFRQFHLKKDITSINYLKKNVIHQIPDEFRTQRKNIEHLITQFEDLLDKKPPIVLKITVNGEKLDLYYHKDYINTILYGGKFHSSANSKERKYYDFFHKAPDQGFKPITRRLFRFNVYSIILEEISFLNRIYIEINNILVDLIEIFKQNGEEQYKKGNYDSSIQNYRNAVYIAEKLDFYKTMASILEELTEVYERTNKQEEISKMKAEITEILSSLKDLPRDFYEDPFYQDYFSMPLEYRDLFNEILPDINLNDKPIIIIPLELINDIKKFENHLNMKNFSFELKHNKLITSSSLAIMRNAEGTIYLDRQEEINLDHKFSRSFVYPDLSCFILLTNDPRMALLDYIYARAGSSLNLITHCYANKLTEFLVALTKIELGLEFEMPHYKNKKEILHGELDYDFLTKYNEPIIRIMRNLIKLSYYPRITEKVDLNDEISSIKRAIQNDSDKILNGQALLSIGISVYLHSVLSGDNQYLENKPQLKPLYKVLDMIKGKDITNDFYHELLKFLDQNFSLFQ